MASLSNKEGASMLAAMFGLSESICLEILKENGSEIDKAVDEILTMKSINGSFIRAPPKKQVEEDEQIRALQLEAKSQKDRQERLLNAHKTPQGDSKKNPKKEPESKSEPAKPPPPSAKAPPSRDHDVLYDSVGPLVFAKHFLEKKKAEEAEKNRKRNEEELQKQKAEIARLKELEKENEKKKRESARLEAQEAKRTAAEAEKERAALCAKRERMEKEKAALVSQLEAQTKQLESEMEIQDIVRAAKDYLHQSLAIHRESPSEEPEYLVQAQKNDLDVRSQLASIGNKPISSNESVPLIQLHYDSNTPQESLKKALSLLAKLGVEGTEIRSLDISEDFELKGYLKSQHHSNELQLPYFFLKTHPLGSFDEVAAFEVPKLKECFSKARNGDEFNPHDLLASSDTPSKPQMGYFDSALGGVETLLSYLNPFSYFRGSGNGELLNGDNVFDILHTNWYGRQLDRKFKFLETTFLRIHAKYGDIRAARPYSDVSLVQRRSQTFLSIDYLNGSSPDWLQGTEHDISAIYAILKSKAKQAKFMDLAHEE